MARPQNPIPSYLRHKASGQAYCRVDGHDVYLGPYGSPQSRRAYQQVITRINDPDPPMIATRATIAARYHRHAAGRYVRRDNGRPTREMDLVAGGVRQLLEGDPTRPAAELGPADIERMQQRMMDNGLSARTINGYLRHVQRAIQRAARDGLIPAETAARCGLVESISAHDPRIQPRTPVQPVAREHVEAILDVVTPPVRAMIEIQWHTAARPGEIRHLQPQEVDTSGEVWHIRPRRHKTAHRGHVRIIYCGPTAQELLRPWLNRGADAYCFSPAEGAAMHNAARRQARQTPAGQGNRPGYNANTRTHRKTRAYRDHYGRRAYARAIERACDKLGVPVWTPNQLRHAAATRIREATDLDTARILLGHRSLEMADHYAKIDTQAAIRAARRMG